MGNSSKNITLGGNINVASGFTTQNNNVVIDAIGGERKLTLNNNLIVSAGSDITLEATGGIGKTISLGGNLSINNNNLTVNVSGTDHTITLSSDTILDQNLATNSTPTFNGLTVTGTTTYNNAMNVNLLDNSLTSGKFYSSNNSNILGISTINDKETLSTSAMLDITTVTKMFFKFFMRIK